MAGISKETRGLLGEISDFLRSPVSLGHRHGWNVSQGPSKRTSCDSQPFLLSCLNPFIPFGQPPKLRLQPQTLFSVLVGPLWVIFCGDLMTYVSTLYHQTGNFLKSLHVCSSRSACTCWKLWSRAWDFIFWNLFNLQWGSFPRPVTAGLCPGAQTAGFHAG